jgi:hypothetical protein
MGREKEKEVKKTGASPLWAVRIFLTSFDAVVGHGSPPAVGFHFATRSK